MRKFKNLQEHFKKYRAAKEQHRIQLNTFVRVALAAPALSDRKLQELSVEWLLDDTNEQPIGKSRIGSVRSTIAHVLLEQQRDALRERIAAYAATHDGVVRLIILHVHDEARLRVKSYTASDAIRNVPRTRYTPVFNAVLQVKVGYEGSPLPYVLELEPLASKTAQNLATALLLQLEEVLKQLPQDVTISEVQVEHLMVGDGIASNQQAARKLLHHMTCAEAGPCPALRPRYRCVVLRCASHAANLVMAAAVACDPDLGGPDVFVETLSRLCKYVLPDAGEFLLFRLRSQLIRDTILMQTRPCPAAQHALHSMQQLYGRQVVPDKLLCCRPYALGSVETSVPPDTSDEEHLQFVVETCRKLLLEPEERPCITRFWRFGSCAMQMFRYILLRINTAELFKPPANHRGEGQKRMASVAAFFQQEGTPQFLREVTLAARLVLRAQGVASRRLDPENRPNIVSLVKGAVEEESAKLLADIFGLILKGVDLELDVLRTVQRLLVVFINIVIRFSVYAEYPFRLCLLVKDWNPVRYAQEGLRFLDADAEALDTGFSKPFRQEAMRSCLQGHAQHKQGHAQLGDHGRRQLALDYLFSDRAQEELKAVFGSVLATSLDVERSHNIVKQASERMSGTPLPLGLASRTHILQQYHIWRRPKLQQRADELKNLRKARFMNAQALAVREQHNILPKGTGQLHWEESST